MPDNAVDPNMIVATPPPAQAAAPAAAAPTAAPPTDPMAVQLPVSTASPVPTATPSATTPQNSTVSITADGGKVVTTTIDPTKTYIFVNNKTGETEVMGVGEAGARAAAARGQAISSANKKNKSDWRIFATSDPTADKSTWGNPVLYDKHHKSLLGKIASTVGKVAGFGVLGALGPGALLGGVAGALGSALSKGKGSSAPAAGTPTGQLPLNPVFKAALPTPGALFSGGTPNALSSATGGNPTLEQWAQYAQHPELNFFSNVPRPGYAEGGMVSDGRSDDLQVRLSKGEYVVDAETVALLGNGSTEAGAKKLDEFRVNLRKQKGEALSRGQFTPEARMPEQYMGSR